MALWRQKGIDPKELPKEALGLGETDSLSNNFMNSVVTLIQNKFPNVKCQDQTTNPNKLTKLVPLNPGELALHFHNATTEGKPTWQASLSVPSGDIYLLDAYQGSNNTFIGSKVESEIAQVHGYWEGENDLENDLIVQSLDIETVETVDSGCMEICTSKFRRIRLESAVSLVLKN